MPDMRFHLRKWIHALMIYYVTVGQQGGDFGPTAGGVAWKQTRQEHY